MGTAARRDISAVEQRSQSQAFIQPIYLPHEPVVRQISRDDVNLVGVVFKLPRPEGCRRRRVGHFSHCRGTVSRRSWRTSSSGREGAPECHAAPSPWASEGATRPGSGAWGLRIS